MVSIIHEMYHAAHHSMVIMFSHWNLLDQKVAFHRFYSQKKKIILNFFLGCLLDKYSVKFQLYNYICVTFSTPKIMKA